MSTTALTVIQCMLAAPVHASTGGSPAEPDERHPRRRLAFGISSGHKLSGISFFSCKSTAPEKPRGLSFLFKDDFSAEVLFEYYMKLQVVVRKKKHSSTFIV